MGRDQVGLVLSQAIQMSTTHQGRGLESPLTITAGFSGRQQQLGQKLGQRAACSRLSWTQRCHLARHWQDLGYMILYITGRPDMQKQRVVSWLSQHNFPQGMIFFSDGLVHDPLRQKAIFLRNLMQEVSVSG